MALLKIVKAGAPILKETAAPVKTITKNTKRLLNDMAETMYEAEGVGLAAPQITYIVQGLKEHGVPIADDITTVAEAKDAILQLLGKDERP